MREIVREIYRDLYVESKFVRLGKKRKRNIKTTINNSFLKRVIIIYDLV